MKTENIFATILIHLVNNSLNFVSLVSCGVYESEFTLESVLGVILLNAILFLPFLFTKEYKKVDETSSLYI